MYKCNRNFVRRILMLSFLFSNNLSFVYGSEQLTSAQEKKTYKIGSKAGRVIDDEYYTQYKDIKNEMSYYSNHFVGKTVYCNCDDPDTSQFCRYFKENFEELKLKKFIATCYAKDGKGKLFTRTEEKKGNIVQDFSGYLKGNGSFDSAECLQYLDECDIVVSNPPFSLLNEYYELLKEKEKQFLFVGRWNQISNRAFFYDFKEKLILPGVHQLLYFDRPDGTRKHQGCIWYTNMPHILQEELVENDKKPLMNCLTLHGRKVPSNVNKDLYVIANTVNDIPINHNNFCVPISFSYYGNTELFEIIDMIKYDKKDMLVVKCKDSKKIKPFIKKGKNKKSNVLKTINKAEIEKIRKRKLIKMNSQK